MSYLTKSLFLQFHLGMSNSDTEEEEWAISRASLDGDDNGLMFAKDCPPSNDGVKRCFNTFKNLFSPNQNCVVERGWTVRDFPRKMVAPRLL